jgi:serine/threonine protein kinase
VNVASERSRTAHEDGAESQWVGRELDGRYRLLCLLGEGATGAVFLAVHLPLQKLVAIKVVPEELIGNGESVIRHTRVVIANPQFEHPHVARANDCATLPEGGAYFVMQLCHGRGLGGLLARGERLSWAAACEVGAQIADVLAAAEAAGVVHRDLHPDNILLEEREDGSDFVKVLDFGIAQAVHEAVSVHGGETLRAATWARTVIGTPGYMAPEQAIGVTADHRCDLYALGVILWESIAGRPLFTGPDVASLILQQMREDAPPLGRVAPDTTRPPELDQLIQRLLERSPAARPAHAADVCELLRCLVDDDAFPLAEAPARYRQQTPQKRNAGRRLGLLTLGCLAALWGADPWGTTDPTGGTRAEGLSEWARVESLDPPRLPASTPLPSVSAVSSDEPPVRLSLAPEIVPARSEPKPDRPRPQRQRSVVSAQPPEEVPEPERANDPPELIPAAAADATAALKPAPRAGPIELAQAVRIDPLPIGPIAQVRDLVVSGSVTTSVVRRAVERIQTRVAACDVQNAAGLQEPTELEIDVVFDERGRARDPRTRGASSAALRACVAEAAANIVLGQPPDTGLVKASWRVTFSSE